MKLTIIGASGHGKVVADIAKLNGYDSIEFLDDNSTTLKCGSYPIVGPTKLAERLDNDLFIAIGNPKVRKALAENLKGKSFPVLIHPDAVIAEDVTIGDGSVVMAGAVVNPYCTIGKFCIVNTCSSVDHDCVLENFVHVSVGSHVCGTVTICEGTWIGAGATVSNNVDICNWCMIGAGAVVIRDIKKQGVYIGVPVHLMNGDKQ